MATITTAVYLDGGTARTAGEAMTINSGGSLTIRTDSRVHANAPASMTGYLGAITVNEGECYIDGTQVRWMPYNSGTGNVPAIGTTVSQGGVSGYLLGVWASLTAAPTAAAAAMPATGYIKLREVTGGNYAAGALTGIGASATSPDVTGWLEVVLGSVDITVPRLGKFKTRGDWFYLDNTTGTRAQVLQVPVNGGGANTYPLGAWIETAPGSGVYDQYPALNGASNGWAVNHMGAAEGYSDTRQKFVKMLSTGQMQIGEATTYSSTYASLAAQASTHADWNVTGTYTLTSNLCTVYCSAGHGLFGGETIGLDFTSGTATDQTGVATVLDAYYFTVPITAANTSGNITVRPGATITFTTHGLQEGNQVYLTVSTGTLPSGTYTVHSTETNSYRVLYAHTAALTSGNCSALHTLTVTRTAHGMAIGNDVYLDFTSGGATSGRYFIRAVATNTFNVNYAHSAAIATSNVTEKYHIGYVPAAGCKVRIPNIFLRSATTAANLIPNAAIASRPEFITTSAGAIDIEYLYAENCYARFGQAYALKIWHSCVMDNLEITELATAVDVDDVFIGHYTGGAYAPLTLTSCFAGGAFKNSKFFRQGTPATNAHTVSVIYCKGQTFDNVGAGNLQYARSSGKFNINLSADMTVQNCQCYNHELAIMTSSNVTVSNHTHVDRIIGNTNATSPAYGVRVDIKSNNVTVNGISWAENQHPYSGPCIASASTNVKFRNVGTYASPLSAGTWESSAYNADAVFQSGGNNDTIKIQRCVISRLRGQPIRSINSDKNILIESVLTTDAFLHSVASVVNRIFSFSDAYLNSTVKGLSSTQGVTGQSSVYGTHLHSLFMGKTFGQLAWLMNEPTVETAPYFTMVSGTAKFNSAGGILMGTIGYQAIWEMPFFALGHTGFVNEAVQMSGGTIGNYTLEYQADTGSGYSAWKTLNGTNLSAETVNPAIGVKLKIRITTTATNTTAITFLRIRTTTSLAAQTGNLYPLDTITLTLTGLVAGSDVTILAAGTETVRATQEENAGTAYAYTYETPESIDIAVYNPGYIPFFIRGYSLGSSNASLPCAQVADVSYLT